MNHTIYECIEIRIGKNNTKTLKKKILNSGSRLEFFF